MSDQKKSFWPYGIILFFLVLFSFNGWFAYQAVQSNMGAVEEDTYNKSLQYQDVIDLKNNSKKLGWKINYSYNSNGLEVEILNKENEIVGDLDINLEAVCLSCKEKGFKGTLSKSVNNKYTLNKNLKTGLWLFKLTANKKSEVFYNEHKLLID